MSKLSKSTSGLTLLELAIAIFVLSIGSLATLRAADQSRKTIGGELPRLMARIAAENRIEQLRLLGPQAPGLPGAVPQGPHLITLETTLKATEGGLVQATVSARASSGEGAILVTYLAQRPPQ